MRLSAVRFRRVRRRSLLQVFVEYGIRRHCVGVERRDTRSSTPPPTASHPHTQKQADTGEATDQNGYYGGVEIRHGDRGGDMGFRRVPLLQKAGCSSNGMRLNCGALKKDSFPNLGAPPASSAC